MFRTIIRTGLAAAIVAALLATGAAIAQRQSPDAAMTVGARTIISGQDPSPVDFPGLRGDRPGQPLPAGYAAVAYRVTITAGTVKALPTFVVRCPAGKRLVTMAASESRIAPQVVGLTPFVRRRSFEYQGSPSWGVVVDYNARGVSTGQTVSGSVYGLCR